MSLAEMANDPGTPADQLVAAITAIEPGDATDLPVVRTLTGHVDASVRAAAVSTLPLLVSGQPSQVIDAIIACTSDEDPNVRFWACWALDPEIFGDSPQLRDAFAARLDDTAEDVRCEALYWLAYLRDERALPRIKTALAGRRPLAREVDAAGAFGDPALFPLVYAHRDTVHPERKEAVLLARRLLSPDGVGEDLLDRLAESCRLKADGPDLPEYIQWWQLCDDLTSIAAYRAPGIAAEVAQRLGTDEAALSVLREKTNLGRLAHRHGWETPSL